MKAASSLTSLVFATLLCLSVIDTAHCASWKLQDKRVAAFLPGITFANQTTGWVSGFGFDASAPGPIILITTDGGLTWNNTNIEGGIDSFIFMSVSVSAGSSVGVAAGMGLPTIPGMVITYDGYNWMRPSFPSRVLEAAYVDVQALNNDTLFAYGQWEEVFNFKGEGVQVSTDAKTFNPRNWGQNNGARYGSFVNSTIGWIAGGNLFPLRPAPFPSPSGGIYLSHELHFNHKGIVEQITNGSGIYQGIIASTADGGRNWKTMFNSTQKGMNLYFNGISFSDSRNGWVVAVYKNSSGSGSYIMNTVDGGQNWSIQLEESDLHLYRIRMLDANFGWAVGFKSPDLVLFSGELFKTTDGGRRWERTTIADTIVFDIAIINQGTAYATAFGLDFSTNVYLYS